MKYKYYDLEYCNSEGQHGKINFVGTTETTAEDAAQTLIKNGVHPNGLMIDKFDEIDDSKSDSSSQSRGWFW